MSVNDMYVWCPEEGTGSPGIQVIVISLYVGAESLTQVLCKSSICSKPLNHLSNLYFLFLRGGNLVLKSLKTNNK